jgi:tRNA dimethylallyltransferase
MKLITILGPTSSGKSDLSIQLAHQLQKLGLKVAILGCDSRQVYKCLNLLSGKVVGNCLPSKLLKNINSFQSEGVEHFLIDFVELEDVYNLHSYIQDFINISNYLTNQVDYILLVGGTGLFARAVTEEYQLSSISDEEFKDLNIQELQSKLIQTDFNNSDWNNRIRLINRLKSKNVDNRVITYPIFEQSLKIILKPDELNLESKVRSRIILRIEQGMMEELSSLVVKYGKERINSLGLECKYGIQYLDGLLTNEEFISTLTTKTMQYIKRQNTWNSKEPNSIVINNLSDLLAKLHL